MKSDFERVQEFEKRIVADCDWAVQNGYTLIAGDYRKGSGRCALGACTQRWHPYMHPLDYAANAFDASTREIDSFISGWDNYQDYKTQTEPERMFWTLGQKLRNKYEPADIG